MSLAQLRRSLLDLRATVLWFALGVTAYALFLVAFWPTVKSNAAMYAELLKAFPEAMVKAFGITGDLGSYTGFLGTEYLNLMWPIIAAAFVIVTASAFVAGEVDRGTVELWLSVPARRWRLLAAKEVAVLAGIMVLVAITLASLVVGGWLVGAELTASGLAALGLVLTAFCAAVGGYTALLSALLSSRATAAGIATGVTFASYLAGVLAGLSTNVEYLKYVAFTTALRPQAALQGEEYAGGAIVLGTVGLICALASLAAFERRDANP